MLTGSVRPRVVFYAEHSPQSWTGSDGVDRQAYGTGRFARAAVDGLSGMAGQGLEVIRRAVWTCYACENTTV